MKPWRDAHAERARRAAEALFGSPSARVRARAELARDPADARELRDLEHALRSAREELGASTGSTPERERRFVERVLAGTTRAAPTRRSGARWTAAAALVVALGAGTWLVRRDAQREDALRVAAAPSAALADPTDGAAASVIGASMDALLASARLQLASSAHGGARTAPLPLEADAPLELKLLEARARGLRERRWDGWLRELPLAELSPMAQALWLEVELDRFVLTGSRAPGWSRALAILERDAPSGTDGTEGSRLLTSALERARSYGLAEGDVLVARAAPDTPWQPQWFDDLAVAGREAGLGDARILRAWVDWRGN